jgi:hypothetical protein
MYEKDSYNKFVEDMEEAGYEVDYDYHGRGYYVGPAVRVDRDEEQDVIRATTVHLRRDSMGLGMVIYPG